LTVTVYSLRDHCAVRMSWAGAPFGLQSSHQLITIMRGALLLFLFPAMLMAKKCDFGAYASHDGCLCSNSGACAFGGKRNNICQDGGPGSQFSDCQYGTDCSDCGKRQAPYPPELPPSAPPPPRNPPPSPLPPPPSPGFELVYIAYILGGVAVLVLVCMFNPRCGPLGKRAFAERAAIVEAEHTRRHEQWAKAGVGDLYAPSQARNFAPPVHVQAVVAVPMGMASSGSPSLWQSEQSGGLGCKLVPVLIEAGVHTLADICCVNPGSGRTRYCTFAELRERFANVPAAGSARPTHFDRGPANAQRRLNRVGRTAVSYRAQYDELVADLVGKGVAPRVAAASPTTSTIQISVDVSVPQCEPPCAASRSSIMPTEN
jgi:hypothetical protein